MKRFYPILMASMLSTTAMAQKTTITGILKDSVLNQTEPYATIRVFKSGNMTKPVAMSVTNADGKISQVISGKGKYIITFNSVGKKEVRRELSLNGEPALELGTVNIADDSHSLNNVEVVAQKPIVKMETDKMSYSVQDDVDSKASTVLDMLRKVPMVTVDGQDNITVNGSSSFKIYVNDKPNPMFNSNPSQILKSMPASMVKTIEVVTNPGAKYDAEGAGGILNIVLVSNDGKGGSAPVNGYNGNIAVRYGNQNERLSGFLSGQQGKLTYSANGLINREHYKSATMETSTVIPGVKDTYYEVTSDASMPFALGNMSLSYDINELNNISASAGVDYWNQNYKGYPTSRDFDYIRNVETLKNGYIKQDQPSYSVNANVDYQHYFNKDRKSYMILSYLFTDDPSTNDMYRKDHIVSGPADATVENIHSISKSHGAEHTLQADFTQQLSATHKLNYGAKYIYRRNTSDSKDYDVAADSTETLNTERSLNFKNLQSILAGYAEWNGTFGKFGTKLGMRYEHTWERIEYITTPDQNFKKHYGTWVPNASLTWNIAPFANIGLNYNLRIVRPGISYLNPYQNKTSPVGIVEYGNPDLDVEKSHTVKLVMNFFTPKFMVNASLAQTLCNNQISQYTLQNGTTMNQTYGNVVKNSWTTFNLFANYMICKNSRIMFSGAVDYGDMRSKEVDARNHGWQYHGYAGLQQTLPWELKWSLGAFVNSKHYTLQGYSGSMGFGFTSLTKSFCKDRLNISLNYAHPLSKEMNIKQYTQGKGFTTQQNICVPVSQGSITVTWNFGNTKKQFEARQSNINNDFSEKKSDNQISGVSSGGQGM